MKEFLEFLEQNEEAKNKILALKGDPDAIAKAVAVAKEYGFDISEADMTAERDAHFGRPYSDEELEAIAGGDACICAVGGGGSSDGVEYSPDGEESFKEHTCACVLGGGGEWTNPDGEKECRCACVVGGVGGDIIWE